MSCAVCADIELENGDTVRCCSGDCLILKRFDAGKNLAEDHYLKDSAPRRMANALNAVKKSVS